MAGSTAAAGHRLSLDHDCRVDDLRYESLDAWWRDHQGRVPIQAAEALDRDVRRHRGSFGEAFAALTGHRGPIVLINDAANTARRGR